MPDSNEIKSLAKSMNSVAFRKSFATNPMWALEHAGIKIDNLPPKVVDALADLSPEEMQVIGRLQDKVGGDLAADDTNGYVVF